MRPATAWPVGVFGGLPVVAGVELYIAPTMENGDDIGEYRSQEMQDARWPLAMKRSDAAGVSVRG